MSRALTEKEVLHKLDIPDFRYLSKDKVMTFASMLTEMDPEVAKKALEQFPEFAKTVLEITKDYQATLEKAMLDNSQSVKVYYDACTTIIESLQKELENDHLTFEERMEISDKMIEISKMMGEKDTENKGYNIKVIAIIGVAAAAVVGGVAAVLGVNTNLNLPKKR
jgi:hypothetical protein